MADAPATLRTPETPPWHGYEIPRVAALLDSDPRAGLSDAEAGRRLEAWGANRLTAVGRPSSATLLVRQFMSSFTVILFLAAALSAALGEVVDAVAIAAILVLNGALGWLQEWRAERALAALRRLLRPTATVVRSGHTKTLSSEALVPGDLIRVETGDRVAADARLLEATSLRTDEASLTGESAPVSKSSAAVPESAPPAERGPILWMGTTVLEGRGLAMVVATGMQTEFGRIAHLTQAIGTEETPLARKLDRLARRLGAVSIVIAGTIGLVGLALGREPLEMFMTGVSLAVAVVPEGLPAVVTITLALGARAMATRRALLRRLPAAETLGEATVICTDKTGTLTESEMTVRELWLPGGELSTTGSGYDPAGHFERDGQRVDYRSRPDLLATLETGLLCNHARVEHEGDRWIAQGDATEAAVVVAAYKAWLSVEAAGAPVAELPFSSERKRMTVVERRADRLVAHVKGAPEVLLPKITHVFDEGGDRRADPAVLAAARGAYERMAERGLRTLLLARRHLDPDAELRPDEIEADLSLLGVLGILDPPRPEVPDAVALARNAGVSVIMITGDAPPTALAIAKRIGLPVDRAITGAELEKLDDEGLIAALDGRTVFARTMPEQKLRIVSALQAEGHVVGMTGDGVNDAPALKKADIGIAMGIRGTDVAKDASDIVISDDNFASILSAVEEGRRQFDNIRKFVRYLLSSNVGEVTAILANLVIGGPLILLPIQILWMNLVTDGATALGLGLEPVEPDVMRRPPRDPTEPIVDRSGLYTLLALGLYIGLATLWLFQHYQTSHGPEGLLVAQTVAFTGIILLEKMNVFNFRCLRGPLTEVGVFSNRWLLLAWTGTVAIQILAVYYPPLQRILGTTSLALVDWLHMVVVALPVFLVPEAIKWLLRLRNRTDRGLVTATQGA
ncbi:MAG: cation-transporting P-type ATPase [Gemmatimonadetes bacterium]|nr:cation-transporting P-type ATPase [Gemmatimonadota bacterium]